MIIMPIFSRGIAAFFLKICRKSLVRCKQIKKSQLEKENNVKVSTGGDDKSSPSPEKSANLVEKVAELNRESGLNKAEEDAEFDEDYDYDDEDDEDHINDYNHDGYAFNQVNEWAFLLAL